MSEHNGCPETQGPACHRGGKRPENRHVGAKHDEQAPDHGPFAEPGRFVLERMQTRAAIHKTVDGPPGQAEQAELLGWRRLNGEPVGVVGITLRAAHLLRVAVAPDAALAQQPVCGQPSAAE